MKKNKIITQFVTCYIVQRDLSIYLFIRNEHIAHSLTKHKLVRTYSVPAR